MKAAYCLDKNGALSVSGILRAIEGETRDELGISLSDVQVDSIFAFYRDAVEGGKPQFLFYVKVPGMDREAFLENISRTRPARNPLRRSRDTITDGDDFVFVKVSDLPKCRITAGSFTLPDGKTFAMMPTATGAVVLLMRYLGISSAYSVDEVADSDDAFVD